MKKFLKVTTLSLVLAASCSWANADNTVNPTVTAAIKSSNEQQLKDLSVIADNGFNAMRNIQYARLAIFSGNTELATELTTEAETLLNDDSIEWNKFVKEVNDSELSKNDQFIVIDASISIDKNYVATPEKDQVIEKANEKFKAGNEKEAIEELSLAGISVNETQYLMPLNLTKQAVSDALNLLKNGKYYEANLVLRDVEQAIIVNSITLTSNE